MKNVSPILRALGLVDSEIRTYMSALENGAGTVLELSKNTRLSRQATYDAIESLTKRGLMTSVVQGKKRYYSAEHPERLLDHARRREAELREHVKDLERSLPELELQMGGERPVVKVYEGKEGIRAIIEDMKNSKHQHSEEIADLDAMYSILTPEDLQLMRTEVKKLGVHIQGLYAGMPSKKVADSERHVLPKEFSGFKSNITIYGDKIALVTFEGKMHSVLIESQALAKTLRVLFTLAFREAKKFPEE